MHKSDILPLNIGTFQASIADYNKTLTDPDR